MEKSLQLLLQLKTEKLQEAKAQGTYLLEIHSFVNQLKEDFKAIAPLSYDPIKQAENLIKSLSNIAERDFTAFSQYSLDKLLLIYDIFPNQAGEEMYIMSEFYSGIETVLKRSLKLNGEKITEENGQNIARIEKAITTLKNSTSTCKDILCKIISQEATKLPNHGSQYYLVEEKNIREGIFDIDQLANDLINRTGKFADSTYASYASQKLETNVRSYLATKKLYATLEDSKEPDPIKRLKNYKHEYSQKETKEALLFNPNPEVKMLFIKIGYYLANVFTFGAVHLLTKGSPIMSPQQKLNKQAHKAIKVISEDINLSPRKKT